MCIASGCRMDCLRTCSMWSLFLDSVGYTALRTHGSTRDLNGHERLLRSIPAIVHGHTTAHQSRRKVPGVSKSPELYTGLSVDARNSIALCIAPGCVMSCGWMLPNNLQYYSLPGRTEELSV
jgi:hypothetical protein